MSTAPDKSETDEAIEVFQRWHTYRYGRPYEHPVDDPRFITAAFGCRGVLEASSWEEASEIVLSFMLTNRRFLLTSGISWNPTKEDTYSFLSYCILMKHESHVSPFREEMMKKVYHEFFDIRFEDLLCVGVQTFHQNSYFIATSPSFCLRVFDEGGVAEFHRAMVDKSYLFRYMSNTLYLAKKARPQDSRILFADYVEKFKAAWCYYETDEMADLIRQAPSVTKTFSKTKVEAWARDFVRRYSGLRYHPYTIREIVDNIFLDGDMSKSFLRDTSYARDCKDVLAFHRAIAELNRAIFAMATNVPANRRVVHPLESVFFGDDWVESSKP